MVFYGLRKFARELGLEIQSGVAYGIYERYAVSMWEGNGYKAFNISAKFEDDLCKKMEMELMELEANYRRVAYIRFIEGVLEARFVDNPGTMKQFRNCFFDVLSVLDEYEIPDADICPKCGLPMYGQGVWSLFKLYGRKSCLYTHEHCAAAMEREVNRQLEWDRQHLMSKEEFIESMMEIHGDESLEELEKLYEEIEKPDTEQRRMQRRLPGWVGALGGAVLGAFILAAAYEFLGTSAIYVSLLCAEMVRAGYKLTKDVRGKKSDIIMIIMSLLSVFLAAMLDAVSYGADITNWYRSISGMSVIEKYMEYIAAGFRVLELHRENYLIFSAGGCLLSLIGLLDIILDLFWDHKRSEKIQCKRLQKRK